MKWFKKITRVLTGLLATTSFIGCHKAEEPVCIYGPPPHEEEPNIDTGENNGAVPAYPGDMEALKEANQGGADVLVAIYGPQPDEGAVPAYPGDMEALKEASQGGADVPVAIYGPQPDDGAVPAYPGPDGDDDSAKRNDEANSEINELRKIEERAAIRALYGVRPPTFKK
ncbi:MAG: hypothetical protein J6S69_10650 [Proteobacteria bacterium]|nr:hypothetical protein [Pseudomonadota bacterium]